MAEAEKDKKKLEEKYMMLQLIDAQLRELEKELSALEQRNLELARLKESLDNLSELKGKPRTYMPIGAGIYAEGNISDAKELLVNVGSGVVVRKSADETKKLLDNQLKHSEGIILQLAQNMQMLSMRAQQIEKEIQNQAEVG